MTELLLYFHVEYICYIEGGEVLKTRIMWSLNATQGMCYYHAKFQALRSKNN